MNKPIRILIAVLMTMASIAGAMAQDAEQEPQPKLDYKGEPFSYIPQFGFTLRTRVAYSMEARGFQFSVRNTRVSMRGMAASFLSYRAEVDLYSQGKFSVSDVFLRGHIGQQLFVTVGRHRDPFGIDVTASPATQTFANRSFGADCMSDLRDIGISATYQPAAVPLIAEVGVYNGSGDALAWHGSPLAAARLGFNFQEVNVSASFRTYSPDSLRMNFFDAGFSWSHDRFFAEAEYIYQHYARNAHKAAHGVNVMATYTLPIQSRVLSALTFGARFDYMSDHSTGYRDVGLKLITDNPQRSRLTLGLAALRFDKVNARLRLDYEKYFGTRGLKLPDKEGDNILLELVVYM